MGNAERAAERKADLRPKLPQKLVGIGEDAARKDARLRLVTFDAFATLEREYVRRTSHTYILTAPPRTGTKRVAKPPTAEGLRSAELAICAAAASSDAADGIERAARAKHARVEAWVADGRAVQGRTGGRVSWQLVLVSAQVTLREGNFI